MRVSPRALCHPDTPYPEYVRLRRCASKKRYETRKDGERARMRSMRAYNEHMEAYYCSECDGWHVGHAQPLIRKVTRVD